MHNADWSEMAQQGEPLVIVEGRGLRVKDANGKTWIDVNGGYASVNIGYGRQEIAEAAYDQLQRIAYFPQRTTNPPTVLLAAKLAEMTPGSLSRTFLVSSGSEANETALKIARAYHHRRGDQGRYKIISRRGSYHGATAGVLWLGSVALSPRTDYEPAYPGMLHAPQPNVYRCEFGSKTASECAVRCVKAIEELILFHQPQTVAAVIAEPIASGPGAVVPGDEYWPMLREICDKYGVLLIIDEIITGFGRTGRMFAVEHWGVIPDITTLGKGISSSYLPLSATVVRKEIAEAFTGEDKLLRHVFTFAGHPVAAAAGLKNIEIIERERLVENAAEVGSYFKGRLEELHAKHPIIGDVRGIGLMLSIELVADRATKARFPRELKVSDRISEKFKHRGLLMRAHGDTLVNMTPPLCITKGDVNEIIAAVDDVLGELEAELDMHLECGQS
jgi:adenosylmethionine-8-amino-7-oxononanoate aminotransferase